jgi:hypothetical protein
MKAAQAAAMSARVAPASMACVTLPTDLMKRFFDWFNNLYPVWLVSLAVHRLLQAADDAVVRQAVDLLVARGVDARHGPHAEH